MDNTKEVKLTVVDRRVLVHRMEELTGFRARFQPGKQSSYQIDRYTVTRNGTLMIPVDADYEMLRILYCEHLIENPEKLESTGSPETAEELRKALNREKPRVPPEDEPPCEHTEEPNEHSIFLPITSHTGVSLRNLVRILYFRSNLIWKATGAKFYIADSLIRYLKNDQCVFSTTNFVKAMQDYKTKHGICIMGALITETHVIITAEPVNTDAEHRKAFCDLIYCINETALKQKQVRMKKSDEYNEKFIMRIWLDSIGLRGANYKQSRRFLMKPLTGIMGYKTKEQLDAGIARYKKRRNANHE